MSLLLLLLIFILFPSTNRRKWPTNRPHHASHIKTQRFVTVYVFMKQIFKFSHKFCKSKNSCVFCLKNAPQGNNNNAAFPLEGQDLQVFTSIISPLLFFYQNSFINSCQLSPRLLYWTVVIGLLTQWNGIKWRFTNFYTNFYFLFYATRAPDRFSKKWD